MAQFNSLEEEIENLVFFCYVIFFIVTISCRQPNGIRVLCIILQFLSTLNLDHELYRHRWSNNVAHKTIRNSSNSTCMHCTLYSMTLPSLISLTGRHSSTATTASLSCHWYSHVAPTKSRGHVTCCHESYDVINRENMPYFPPGKGLACVTDPTRQFNVHYTFTVQKITHLSSGFSLLVRLMEVREFRPHFVLYTNRVFWNSIKRCMTDSWVKKKKSYKGTL